MKKERVLIVYEDFSAGGSTTSLFALLRAWDYGKYDVDILPYRLTAEQRSELLKKLPEQVNLLDNAVILGNSPFHLIVKGAKMIFCPPFHKAMRARKKGLNKYIVLQYMAYAKTRFCRGITENYRAVIAFIEGWSTVYALSGKVRADKRIAFLHLDYKSAGVNADIDRALLGKADGIVTVSESCADGLRELYPEYADRIAAIENIHSVERIIELSRESVEGLERFDLLTVCRPDIKVKGLDRIAEVAVIMRDLGYKFDWKIVGVGGNDRVEKLFEGRGLEGYVTLVETVENPFPYYTHANWLVVTSRTEAKPMTVTEAQILGVPCIVTEYSSAREQVRDGIDGIVTENSVEGIVSALRKVMDDPTVRRGFTEALKEKNAFPDASEAVGKLFGLFE